MSSLASVYHKPAGTFIGLGRIGADSVPKKEECVFLDLILRPCGISPSPFSVSDDRFSAQKALQTVAAGQQAENLLDFDDVPSDQPSGLAATQISTTIPAAANLIAGTSSNPLDDLVSIFGNMSTTQPPLTPAGPQNLFGSQPQQQQNAFGGLGVTSPTSVTSPPPQQAQKQEEDLLGLF